MRLPWLKIAQEIREATAGELATRLYPPAPPELEAQLRAHYRVEVEHLEKSLAGWGIVEVIGWALGRCPENEPPSAHAVVKGPTAAREIARVAGWKGDPEVYVKACAALTFPLLEIVADGVRVRGLDRYDEAWGERHREAWAAWKAARPSKYPPVTARRTSGEPSPKIQRPDPDPDADPDASKTPPNPPLSQEGGERKEPRRAPRRRRGHLQPVPTPEPDPWDRTTPAGKAWCARLDAMRERGATYAVSQLERLEPQLVDGVLVVHAPDPFFGEWVEEHYLEIIHGADIDVAGATGPPTQLKYPPKREAGASA